MACKVNFILVSFFLLTLSVIVTSNSQETRKFWPKFWNCDYNAGNFTESSSYNATLSNVLSKLTSLSSSNSFSNVTMKSDDANEVYALYDCRDDLPLQTCHGCIEDAARSILDLCYRRPKEAIVMYEECMLRYANRMIFSTMELKPYESHCGGVKYLGATDILGSVKRNFDSLIENVTSENSSKYYGVGQANNIANRKVYFLVQCTPDLSMEQCKGCLLDSLNFTVESCAKDNRLWGYVMRPSCRMRYDIEPFFNVSSEGIPPTGSSQDSTPSISNESVRLTSTGIFRIFLFLIFVFCLL